MWIKSEITGQQTRNKTTPFDQVNDEEGNHKHLEKKSDWSMKMVAEFWFFLFFEKFCTVC